MQIRHGVQALLDKRFGVLHSTMRRCALWHWIGPIKMRWPCLIRAGHHRHVHHLFTCHVLRVPGKKNPYLHMQAITDMHKP